jgi:hypothetical protein
VTPPTEAEIAHARKLFDEFQEQIDNVAEADIPKEVSSKFFDDVSGTEYEGRPRSYAMSKKMAGKTFSTPEEVGVTRPTDEELAHARQLFDTSGTEYEGWQDR